MPIQLANMATQSTSNRQPTVVRSSHIQIPNNVPKPPIQDTNQRASTTPLSKLNKISNRIVKTASRGWKSFQQRSLANDERYHLDLLRIKKNNSSRPQPNTLSSPMPHDRPPEHFAPYPNIDAVLLPAINELSCNTPLSRRRPMPPPLSSITFPLSYAARLIPYRPGLSTVQPPFYPQIRLPQQLQQLQYTIQDPAHRRPLPPKRLAIPYPPYTPYCRTYAVRSPPGTTASRGRRRTLFVTRDGQSRLQH